MFSSLQHLITASLAFSILCAVAQEAVPVVDHTDAREKTDQARMQWLADPAIAPLHGKLLEVNARLHAAREARLANTPGIVEKQAELQGLLAQLSALNKNREMPEADRRTQRRAIATKIAPLTAAITAARNAVQPDEAILALQKQAEAAEAELNAAIDKKLAAVAAAPAVQAAPAQSEPTGETAIVPVKDTSAETVTAAPAVPPAAAGAADGAAKP